jgi:hypothetical protein
MPPPAGGMAPPALGSVAPPPAGGIVPPPASGTARAAARRPGEPSRHGTGEHARVGSGTGEPARHGSGEQPALRLGSGEQAYTGVDDDADRPGYPPRPTRPAHILALAVVAVLLLGVLPLALFLHSAGSDPVVTDLNSLSLPAWADVQHQDDASGSRWCIKDCRLRERTWRSEKSATETDAVFQTALTGEGWVRSQAPGCPKIDTGTYTCWQHDQYVLDLWTRNAVCGLSGVAPSPGAPPPSASPSATSPLDPVPTASGPPPTCAGALVTAKVDDGIDPNWHRH